MELQSRGSSRPSISGDSVSSQIEVDEGDDLENRPKSKEIVDALEGTTNSTAALDQIPTDALQEPLTPPAPLCLATVASVPPRLKSFVPVGDEQTEKEGKTIPVTLSEAPYLLPTQRYGQQDTIQVFQTQESKYDGGRQWNSLGIGTCRSNPSTPFLRELSVLQEISDHFAFVIIRYSSE